MTYLRCFRPHSPKLSCEKLAAIKFFLILLRVSHNYQFFYVSFRVFGRESGRTSRLKPVEVVLRSRSESTTYAYTPESDSEDLYAPYIPSSRSVSPEMSNTNANQPSNPAQTNQPATLPNIVHNSFFNQPPIYPQVPSLPNFGGPAPNPQPQPLYNAAPLHVPQEMYSPAQVLQMMASMQHILRNTSF